MNYKKLKIDISRVLVVGLLKIIISLIISTVPTGATYVVLNYLDILKNKSLFRGIITLLILIVFVIAYKKINKKIPNFPVINADFQVLELEIIHRVETKHKCNHISRYKLKAKKDGLRSYRGRFLWLGGKAKIKSGDNKHFVHLSKKINVFEYPLKKQWD